MVFWGGTFVTGRILMRDMTPAAASFLRFFMAALALMAWGARLDPAMLKPTRRQLAMFLVLGASGVFAYNMFFMAGLQTVPAGRGAIIIAVNPVLTACLAAILFGEALRGLRAVGVGISLFGALTVVTGGDYGSLITGMSPGDLLLCGAVFCWSTYSLAGKQAMKKSSPITSVGWSAVLGSMMLFPAAMYDGLIPGLAHAGVTHWGCLAYMSFGATVLAFMWFYEGIKAIGAARAAAFINLVPVFASLFGYLVLDERLAWSTLAGGALVMTGVVLTNRPQKTPLAVASAPEAAG